MREEKKGKEGKGRKGKGKEGKEGGTAAAPPAPSRQLLPQLAAPRLWQAGSMAAVESRVCETAGCSSEAKLQCPTCLKLGIQGSYFCSQVRALPLLPPAAGGCGGGGVGACVHGVGGDPCAGGCLGLAAAAAPGLVPLRERGASVPPRPMEGPFGGPPFGFLGLDGAKRGVLLRVPLRLQQHGLVALPSSFAGSCSEARAPWGHGSAPCFFLFAFKRPWMGCLKAAGRGDSG